jgi:hypothetical protein
MSIKIAFYYSGILQKWIEYAFSILSSSLDCHVEFTKEHNISDDQNVIVVSYGTHIPTQISHNHLHIFADPSFAEHVGIPQRLPRSPLYRYPLQALRLLPNQRLEDPLIFPYVHENNHAQPVYWKTMGAPGPSVLVCQCDLLASAFFWLTRYEEVFSPERDELGRFPENQLLCVREHCASRPLVDEYAEMLQQLLNHFGQRVNRRREAFRVLITHDVDSGIPRRGGLEHVANGLRSMYREVVRERRARAGLTSGLQWFALGMGWRAHVDLFRHIVQVDKTYGYTSHFFLMANGTHPKDALYAIDGDYARHIMQVIKACGGRIGLHLGINAHTSCQQFTKEWCTLRTVFPDTLPAARSHFLVFHAPDTWKKLSAVGCRVDTTLGFSTYMGFRAGTSRPFRPFDIAKQGVLPVWEYPLILMDKHLFALPARSDTARLEQAFHIIDKVAAHGGCLVINWHNAYFFADYLSMYIAILDYVTKRGEDVRLADSPEPEPQCIW